MTSNFSSNNNKPRTARRRFKPKKYKVNTTIKKSPEQVKQEKISKLRDQIADLRRKKAELRTKAREQQKNLQSIEFRAKLDAIDAKITEKMQQLRDTASNVIQKVKDVAAAPAVGAKRAWDNWEI